MQGGAQVREWYIAFRRYKHKGIVEIFMRMRYLHVNRIPQPATLLMDPAKENCFISLYSKLCSLIKQH
jgi:hypothetical protein